jgi:hypothetical protein
LFATAAEVGLNLCVERIRDLDERFYIIAAIFAFAFQLFLSALGVVIINQMIMDKFSGTLTSIREGLEKNLKYVFIESTRAILPISLKLLFFIVPGIIEAIRLYFVPYVAQFDKEYKEGKIDALKHSRKLVKGHLGHLTVILLFTLLLSMVPSFYLESLSPLTRPLSFTVVFFLCMALDLYGDIVLFISYLRLEEESGNKISLP